MESTGTKAGPRGTLRSRRLCGADFRSRVETIGLLLLCPVVRRRLSLLRDPRAIVPASHRTTRPSIYVASAATAVEGLPVSLGSCPQLLLFTAGVVPFTRPPPAALSLAAPADGNFVAAPPPPPLPPLTCVSRCFRLDLRGSFGISPMDLLNRIIARNTLSASASPRKRNALSTMPNPEEGATSEAGGIDGSSQERVPIPSLAGRLSPAKSNSDGGVVPPEEHADTGLSPSRSITPEHALL